MELMMGNVFWLYVLTRLDKIEFVLTICLAFGTLILCLKWFNYLVDDGLFKPEKAPWVIRKVEYIIVGAMIGMLLLPTQKDIAVIHTGSVIVTTLDTDKAKVIKDKTIRVIEKKLDDELKKE